MLGGCTRAGPRKSRWARHRDCRRRARDAAEPSESGAEGRMGVFELELEDVLGRYGGCSPGRCGECEIATAGRRRLPGRGRDVPKVLATSLDLDRTAVGMVRAGRRSALDVCESHGDRVGSGRGGRRGRGGVLGRCGTRQGQLSAPVTRANANSLTCGRENGPPGRRDRVARARYAYSRVGTDCPGQMGPVGWWWDEAGARDGRCGPGRGTATAC